MKPLFKYALITAAVLGAAALMVANSNAGTIRTNSDSCITLAQAAGNTAVRRDAGETWEADQQAIVTAVYEAKGTEGSIINDDDDVTLVLNLLETVFHSKMDPQSLAQSVYTACMAGNPKLLSTSFHSTKQEEEFDPWAVL